MKTLFIVAVVILLANLASGQQEPKKNEASINVHIRMISDTLHSGETPKVGIWITNSSSKSQRLLFDKPKLTTGGPWFTSAKVSDVITKQSVLEYENKAILESQVYLEEKLRKEYRLLLPNKSLYKVYKLTDIVVYKNSNDSLSNGKYSLQIFYQQHASNIITFVVR